MIGVVININELSIKKRVELESIVGKVCTSEVYIVKKDSEYFLIYGKHKIKGNAIEKFMSNVFKKNEWKQVVDIANFE